MGSRARTIEDLGETRQLIDGKGFSCSFSILIFRAPDFKNIEFAQKISARWNWLWLYINANNRLVYA